PARLWSARLRPAVPAAVPAAAAAAVPAAAAAAVPAAARAAAVGIVDEHVPVPAALRLAERLPVEPADPHEHPGPLPAAAEINQHRWRVRRVIVAMRAREASPRHAPRANPVDRSQRAPGRSSSLFPGGLLETSSVPERRRAARGGGRRRWRRDRARRA